MIHSIYIIHDETGICLCYRVYGDLDLNEDIVSGYITAIRDASVDVVMEAGQISVIDMKSHSLMLLSMEDVFIACSSDNIDDIKIIHDTLTKIIDKFIVRYKTVLERWNSNVRLFSGFVEIFDEYTRNGVIAEITMRIPLLKIYRKHFKKTFNLLTKKVLVVKQRDLITNKEKNPEWISKKLPRTVLAQGFMTEEEYNIAHLMNGLNTVEQIAGELGIQAREVQQILYHLKSLGLILFVDLEAT